MIVSYLLIRLLGGIRWYVSRDSSGIWCIIMSITIIVIIAVVQMRFKGVPLQALGGLSDSRVSPLPPLLTVC